MNPVWDLLKEAIIGTPPGVQRRLVHTWPWPHWVTAVILVLGVLVTVWIYLRERSARRWKWIGASLRCLVVLILVLVMGYGWQLATDLTDLPDLIIAVDDSSSMLTADLSGASPSSPASPGRITRFSWVREMLSDGGRGWLRQLRARYRLKLYRLAADLRPVNTAGDDSWRDPGEWELDADLPQHNASRLGTALRAILDGQRGRPTAAVVLFTDGITTDGKSLSEMAAYARRLDIPLYVIGVGNEQPAVDARISDILADDTVFVGDVVHFDVRVSGSGLKGRSLTTRLRLRDQEVLAEKTQVVSDDSGPTNIRLSFRPEEVGEFNIVIEVDVGSDDINPGNNRVERQLNVRDEVIRVLYVQQYPSFDFRYLKTLLERGLQRGAAAERKSIELDVVLQEADADYAAIDSAALRAFPVDPTELLRYDVVVFGDVDAAFFTESMLNNLADFVTERGGGLVFLCGPRHTPWSYRGTALDSLMPVDTNSIQPPTEEQLLTGGYRVIPSPLAQDSPVLQLQDDESAGPSLWAGFPELFWVAQVRDLKPAARVLAEARGRDGSISPLLVMQFVGAGKVIMLMSDEFYRLARHPDGELYYARFWMQVLRYLSRGKLQAGDQGAKISVDQEAYVVGDTASVTVRFLDERQAPASARGVTVQLEQRGGRRRTLTLERDALQRGVFRTSLSELTEGEYRVWLATPTLEGQPPSARFAVTAPRGEAAYTELDLEELQQSAKVSRGKFYTPANAERVLADIPEGRQVRIQALPPQPIWNSPVWPALIVILLSLEWLLRKKGGML